MDQPLAENTRVDLPPVSELDEGLQGEARFAYICRIASNTAIGVLLAVLLYLAYTGEKRPPTNAWRIAIGVDCVLMLACCLVPSLLRAHYHRRRGRSAISERKSVSWL